MGLGACGDLVRLAHIACAQHHALPDLDVPEPEEEPDATTKASTWPRSGQPVRIADVGAPIPRRPWSDPRGPPALYRPWPREQPPCTRRLAARSAPERIACHRPPVVLAGVGTGVVGDGSPSGAATGRSGTGSAASWATATPDGATERTIWTPMVRGAFLAGRAARPGSRAYTARGTPHSGSARGHSGSATIKTSTQRGSVGRVADQPPSRSSVRGRCPGTACDNREPTTAAGTPNADVQHDRLAGTSPRGCSAASPRSTTAGSTAASSRSLRAGSRRAAGSRES